MTENHQEQLNQNERISVIVPVYNVEDYLQDCIDSITAQTYQNLEILLIDDGSTDRSGQMCDEIAKTDDRIQVIHQKNGGLSAARNTGIEHATADYYIFVDSDDSVEPTFAEDLYTNLITAGADISICGLAWLTEGDVFQQVDTVEVHVIDGREALQKVNDPYFVVQWNKCFKKEIFENLRYPVGRIHEDEFVAAQQLYQAKKVVYTNKRLYRYNASRQDSIT
ncbi:MAG: glycosyltransferase, partial [Erysipelotrichaceae bacterium]|nr:glycosyltransferase [Erysipelotrichaceae bacterium]